MNISADLNTVRTQVATSNAHSPIGSEIMAKQTGQSRTTSEAVSTSTSASDLSDALEELGMAKSERSKADTDKMRVRKGAGADLEALARIAEYYDKLPDLPSEHKNRELVEKLTTFQDQLESGGGGAGMPTADDLRQLLQEFDGDVTHQFAALELATAEFAQAGASDEFMALLNEARQDMRKPEVSQEIIAGFAAAREANSASDRFTSTPEDYRNSYRDMVRAGGNLGRVFDALTNFTRTTQKEPDIGETLDSFIKVAGDDMSSFTPSTDKTILGDVLAELKTLKSVRTVLDMGTNMMQTMNRMFPNADLPGARQVTSNLFHFTSQPVASQAEAARMVAPFEGHSPEAAVVAINQIRDMHANLPDSAMPNESARLQQSSILMGLSGTLVHADEAQYGG